MLKRQNYSIDKNRNAVARNRKKCILYHVCTYARMYMVAIWIDIHFWWRKRTQCDLTFVTNMCI